MGTTLPSGKVALAGPALRLTCCWANATLAPDEQTAVAAAGSTDAYVAVVGETRPYAEGLGDDPAPQLDASQFHASIMSLPNENLAGPCDFDLWIPDPSTTLDATWITYDRGLDISKYYGDPDVRAFAEKHRIALMMAHQRPAKTPAIGEMDMDLSLGIALTIFAALKNFPEQDGHNDLSDSKLILLGFSGTGVLFARFVAYSPDRVVAAILTALGQGDPFGIEKVDFAS